MKSPIFHADDYGVVRIDYYKHPSAAASVSDPGLTLDCVGPSGVHETVEVESAARTKPVASGLAPGHQRRPALKGNPMTPTDAELLAAHYPPRPDPTAAPKMYANWLALVSKDAEYSAANPSPPAATQFGTAQPYCGLEMPAAEGATYIGVEATFAVPSIVPQATNAAGLAASAGFWVGLNDTVAGHLVQDGVAIQSYGLQIGSYIYDIPYYWAWYEITPTGPTPITNWYPSAGEVVFVYSWICNASRGQDINGNFACFLVYDETLGQITEPAPISYPHHNGGGAFWIMEKNYSNHPVPNYHSATMVGTYAVTSTFQEVDLGTQFEVVINMTNSNNVQLSTASIESNNAAIDYAFHAGQ